MFAQTQVIDALGRPRTNYRLAFRSRFALPPRLRRHPFAVKAQFRHCLVLTYALPTESLERLLPPGLFLDTYRGFGFLAIAVVQTEALRPVFLPALFGQDFFLSGYRIFARY